MVANYESGGGSRVVRACRPAALSFKLPGLPDAGLGRHMLRLTTGHRQVQSLPFTEQYWLPLRAAQIGEQGPLYNSK